MGICQPQGRRQSGRARQKTGDGIGEALIDLKVCNEGNVYKALAAQHGMDYVELDKTSVPTDAINLIPDDLMRKYLILPMGLENGRLRVVVHDPLDLEMLDILRFRLHKEIRTLHSLENQVAARPDSRNDGIQHYRQDAGQDL